MELTERQERIKAASHKYATERTGRSCGWDDCDMCWQYRSDLPCQHRELMLAYAAGATEINP